jgi:hypothetical protein
MKPTIGFVGSFKPRRRKYPSSRASMFRVVSAAVHTFVISLPAIENETNFIASANGDEAAFVKMSPNATDAHIIYH